MEFASIMLTSSFLINSHVAVTGADSVKTKTYMAIDTANAIMLTVTVSETGQIGRAHV